MNMVAGQAYAKSPRRGRRRPRRLASGSHVYNRRPMTRHAPMRQALGALVASLATVAPAAAHMTTAPAGALPRAAPPSAPPRAAASGVLPARVGRGPLLGGAPFRGG